MVKGRISFENPVIASQEFCGLVKFIDKTKSKVSIGVNFSRQMKPAPTGIAREMEKNGDVAFDIEVEVTNSDMTARSGFDVDCFTGAIYTQTG